MLHLLDHPNDRSLHDRPVPRSGGLAILLALVAVLGLVMVARGWSPDAGWLGLALAPVAVVAFFDDRGGVAPGYRLLAQLGAAVLLIAGGLGWRVLAWPGDEWLMPIPLAVTVTALYVVWMTNLYNFMDGIDGLAGGMAVFGFGTLAVLGWTGGELTFTLTAAAIAAAAGGFLTRNFPRARLFLGDVGSSALGLLAAGMGLWGSALGLFPLWVAWLAFSPFIVDATWTLLRRAWRRERVWLPHRSHHYQRLVLSGWSHRRTSLWAYLVMMATSVSAVTAPVMSPHDQWVLLLAWAAIFVLIHVKVRGLQRG
jgi:UDP-N-acetylmuramyl pentapeptide phosphotransferase/UDP-N-acetylglucosamine-1-phosphate transferase